MSEWRRAISAAPTTSRRDGSRRHSHSTIIKWRRAAAVFAIGALCACFGEKGAIEPTVPPAEALGSLTMSPDAVILAVGQTRQLTLSATTLTGTPVTAFETVFYWLDTPADSVRISLSPTGLVTALSPGALLRVNVFVKRNQQFAAAQAIFHVTSTAIAGATLSIQPTDSSRLAAGTTKTIPATLRNPSTGQ